MVMFLHLSVILFTGGVSRTRPRGEGSRPKPGGRGCIPACPEADIPHPPSRRVLLQAVRILLECTLVLNNLFPEDISPFCGALIPLFWTIGDVCPGIQSQSGSPSLDPLYLCATDSSDFTSGATPADLLAASRVDEHILFMYT